MSALTSFDSTRGAPPRVMRDRPQAVRLTELTSTARPAGKSRRRHCRNGVNRARGSARRRCPRHSRSTFVSARFVRFGPNHNILRAAAWSILLAHTFSFHRDTSVEMLMKKAFRPRPVNTLIELLVVIAVIGIVIALWRRFGPVYQRVHRRGYLAVLVEDERWRFADQCKLWRGYERRNDVPERPHDCQQHRFGDVAHLVAGPTGKRSA